MSATTLPLTVAPAAPAPAKSAVERNLALDAFRGFIMFTLASEGFGFSALQHDPTWGRVASWFEHVDWTGGVFWDMIQPSFMFMVGVAMPFALARRSERGATPGQNLTHVAVRSLKLILLSQFLMIASDHQLRFQLINVLSQIAFTYLLTYLILQMKFRWQVASAGLLLLLHTALFMVFPGSDGAFSRQGNIGAVVDKALLGYNYHGYYVTINFISSTVTTLFGAWAGNLLRSSRPLAQKLQILTLAMVGAFVGGLALSPVVPLVKRLWTASFTLYSTGWVLFMMLAFIILIDLLGFRKFAFPFVVVGMNSIFIYSAGFLIKGSIVSWISGFTGFKFAGPLAPVAQNCALMAVLWYLCYWLYRRKIFLKV